MNGYESSRVLELQGLFEDSGVEFEDPFSGRSGESHGLQEDLN